MDPPHASVWVLLPGVYVTVVADLGDSEKRKRGQWLRTRIPLPKERPGWKVLGAGEIGGSGRAKPSRWLPRFTGVSLARLGTG